MDVAKTLAMEHYEKFNERRLLEESQEEADEFDGVAKRIEEEGKEDKG